MSSRGAKRPRESIDIQMDLDAQALLGEASSNATWDDLARTENEASKALQQVAYGSKFPNLMSIMTLGSTMKNRAAVDVVYPVLRLENDPANQHQWTVYIVYDQHGNEKKPLFDVVRTPFMEQLLFLKHFITPENREFFSDWLGVLEFLNGSGMFSPLTWGDDVEQWFATRPGVIDMANPLKGVMEAVADSRGGGFIGRR